MNHQKQHTHSFSDTGRALLRLLRPHQWTKNAFCLFGVLFSGRYAEPHAIPRSLLTFAVFCAASSAVYILNDLIDRDRDRQHPAKRDRPLASGTVNATAAGLLALLLAAAALVGSALLKPSILACVILYMANNAAYSWQIKHLALFDVLSIALGFCLRLVAGVYAVDDVPTTWIALCTFFLAVFLGFAKRRAELARHGEGGDEQRPVLAKYSVQFLDYLLNSSAVMAVMSYALFTSSSGKNPTLVITVPIVFYAVMHYKRLVLLLHAGEEPEQLLLRDYRIQLSIVLWLLTYFAVMHGRIRLFR